MQTALFDKFERIYLHKFTDQFKTEKQYLNAMDEWAEGLFDLSGQQISLGIDRCRKEKSWPPSIAEFRALAEEDKDWQHKGSAYKDFHRQLPPPKSESKKMAVRALLKETKKNLGWH